jgi:hypothetical protein
MIGPGKQLPPAWYGEYGIGLVCLIALILTVKARHRIPLGALAACIAIHFYYVLYFATQSTKRKLDPDSDPKLDPDSDPLTAALGGLDALVFTAGIGEKSPVIRPRVCQGLAWLGITIETDANQRGSTCISPKGQAPSVWVIPTDEEAVIASHTLALFKSTFQFSGQNH